MRSQQFYQSGVGFALHGPRPDPGPVLALAGLFDLLLFGTGFELDGYFHLFRTACAHARTLPYISSLFSGVMSQTTAPDRDLTSWTKPGWYRCTTAMTGLPASRSALTAPVKTGDHRPILAISSIM